MQLTPYLHFSGNCREAFTFYADVLDGKIVMLMTFGDSPMAAEIPPAARETIMHVRLEAAGALLMGSDAPPDRFRMPAGFSVSLGLDDIAAAERIYAAFADGGTVAMPLQQTFWAKRFGMVTDRFGTPWLINCE